MNDRPAVRFSDDPVSRYGWMRVESRPSRWYLISRATVAILAGWALIVVVFLGATAR